MTGTRRLETGLAIVRLTAAAFFLVWSVEKIVAPERAVGVFQAFYFVESLPAMGAVLIGVVQTAIILAFACGLWKLWTYGAVLLMHGASTLSTVAQLADPYSDINHLFWAAVPVLGALIALFILREEDKLLTLGGSASG
ncbi:MAG: DoxX protein [Alphaproteobacteria bacterium]|nr:DoxX protein [Alphaproteobacteria bacterium]